MKYIKQLLLLITVISLSNCSSSSDSSAPNVEVPPSKPTLTTKAVSGITLDAALSGGSITSDGGSEVTARGVVWSTQQNPTITLTTKTTDGIGTGFFDSAIADLDSNTTYYIRAYATNDYGTAYGNQLSFTTSIDPADLPTVTTLTVTDITPETAMTGGTVTNTGASAVTSRGVVWSLNTGPTVDINSGITTNGSNTGSFTSSISGLAPSTTYYVRAYATNAYGTGYGNEYMFSTIALLYTPGSGATDIDGNLYSSTILNGQEWTTTNLNVTKYTDGTPIPQVQDAATWAGLTTGAWCYYAYQTSNGTVYGKLYNWYAVAGIWDADSQIHPANRKTLAPTGWHIPSSSEWNSLTTFLGGTSIAGGPIKEAGTAHWTTPNTGAVNSSGLTALPGGNCSATGAFSGLGTNGNWWINEEYNPTSGWCVGLFNINKTVLKSPINKKYGYSVRLLKN